MLEKSVHVMLCTGDSGICITMFMIYFLSRYNTDMRFSDRNFIFERLLGHYCYFQPKENESAYEFIRYVNEFDFELLSKTIVISDMRVYQEPLHNAKFNLILVSQYL